MATMRQKRVARLIVQNLDSPNPLNKGEIIEKARYTKVMAKQPSTVIDSQGVQDELALLGFTPENAKSVVSKIMNNDEVEPNARLKAADMTFKVHGTYAPEKSITIALDATVDKKDLSLAKQLLGKRRRSKTSGTSSDGVIPVAMGGEVQNKE